jgi:hypothetical protein
MAILMMGSGVTLLIVFSSFGDVSPAQARSLRIFADSQDEH